MGQTQDPEQNLRKILKIPKLSKTHNITSECFGMVLMEPKGGGVKPVFIGFTRAPNAAEVTDEFEGGQRVVRPSEMKKMGKGIGWGIRDNLEE